MPSAAATRRESSELALHFPWGTLELANGDTLAIGRDESYSPIAPELRRFENVSRRHAELRATDDGIEVHDVGSTNGTFINGFRTTTGQARPGDELRFAASLTVRVERAAARRPSGPR